MSTLMERVASVIGCAPDDEDDLVESVRILQNEHDRWERIAIYLAHCHAATASYDGQLSSVSESRKKRYADICQTAVTLLSGKESPRGSAAHRSIEDELADVISRLERYGAEIRRDIAPVDDRISAPQLISGVAAIEEKFGPGPRLPPKHPGSGRRLCTPKSACGDCWECGPISAREAKRLHEEAETLSVKTLRRIGELRFQRAWLGSAKKRTIVRGLRYSLQRIIDTEGSAT